MRITIETVKHSGQRYETVGDYGGRFPYNFWIKVSRMKDWRHCFLVALHEMVEFSLCYHRGIKNRDITTFDKRFEALREPGNVEEPGNAPDCPYRAEHAFATRLERLMAKELGVDWAVYDRTVNDL